MSNYLMIDIGAGTMDILCYVPDEGMHYKAVVMSPVRTLAAHIESRPGNLVVTGVEMGGGPVSTALQTRAQTAEVIMSASAAATIHHDRGRVESQGIHVVADQEADDLKDNPGYQSIILGDIEPRRIRRIVEGFGLPFEFESVAVCAQDHGVAPRGISHLDFRHQLFKKQLDRQPYPHALLYEAEKMPPEFNRLKSIAQAAARMPTRSVYVMDSGMAAIAGSAQDPAVRDKETFLVLDIATSHTVGAVLSNGELMASFEYHTHDVTLPRLEQLVKDLPDGQIDHAQILAEGGHGAYLRQAPGLDRVAAIVATGPKRRLLADSHLPVTWGAPWGDNMMTGCVGLLESVRQRQRLDPIAYI